MLKKGDWIHNRYEILDIIGRGGMAIVYMARCHKLNRLVAIKVLKEEYYDDERLVEKFKTEAQASANLFDHNIVNIYDVINDESINCIVMELVRGITLKEYIDKKGVLDIKEALGISVQIAMGLSAAHSAGIVHRDIKPQNIIISNTGKVKVTDFGIARVVSDNTSESLTSGSVHYIAPEQACGNAGDNRSDIYSLGITMYEMLTGVLPFYGENSLDIALSHVKENIKSPRLYNDKISPKLERIILRCTEKEPSKRYQSINDLIENIKNIFTEISDEKKVKASKPSSDEETKMFSDEDIAKIKEKAKKEFENDDKEIEDEEDNVSFLSKLATFAQFLAAICIAAILFVLVVRFVPFISPLKSSNDDKKNIISESQASVPHIENMNYELAEQKLKEKDLQIKIIEEEYNDDIPKDSVISQKPEADTVVEKYSFVEVVISKGDDSIDISDLGINNKKLDEVTTLLKDKGLSVKVTEAYSDVVPAGVVISYEPKKVKKSEEVNLTVSKGSEVKMINMPNLSGMTKEQAISVLNESLLKEGNISEEYSNNISKGEVIKQSVESGALIAQNSTVDLVISKGSDSENYKYIASINSSCNIAGLIGPGGGLTELQIMIRLKQIVNGKEKYTTLMEPRTVGGDTILPVRFKYIEGEYGIDKGEVEVVEVTTGNIIKSYTVDFFKVQ